MWQDLVLSVGQLLFSLALLPALRAPTQKPPRSTCFLTGGALLVFALAYASLALWYSGASAALCGGLWLWLGAQARAHGAADSKLHYQCPLTRGDLNDALEQAECSAYDQIKDPGEREYVMDGLRKVRKLVQQALDAPAVKLPIRCAVCTNALTQGNVDACGSPVCQYKNMRTK